MPHGFFTIEQWKRRRRGGAGEWVAVAHLDASGSLSDALAEIERRDRAGLFRIIQTQRQVWAERVKGKLKVRKWHASSPQALERTTAAFAREKGRFNRGTR
jgi:hypothetical protein